MKKLMALVLAVLMIAGLLPMSAMAEKVTRYVYTDNGKSLNMRSEPRTGDNIILQIPYGAKVTQLDVMQSGWIYITYNDYYGYVQPRFLVSSKPASKSKSSSSTKQSATSTSTSSTDAEKVLSDMNKEFRSAKKVTNPYYVVSRPSRASGWVNLRWAPSTEMERIAACPQGKELLVLAELNNWYQVEDPETGLIGYISSKYVSKQ